jgi:hypothetical protein
VEKELYSVGVASKAFLLVYQRDVLSGVDAEKLDEED